MRLSSDLGNLAKNAAIVALRLSRSIELDFAIGEASCRFALSVLQIARDVTLQTFGSYIKAQTIRGL